MKYQKQYFVKEKPVLFSINSDIIEGQAMFKGVIFACNQIDIKFTAALDDLRNLCLVSSL